MRSGKAAAYLSRLFECARLIEEGWGSLDVYPGNVITSPDEIKDDWVISDSEYKRIEKLLAKYDKHLMEELKDNARKWIEAEDATWQEATQNKVFPDDTKNTLENLERNLISGSFEKSHTAVEASAMKQEEKEFWQSLWGDFLDVRLNFLRHV